MGRTDWNGELLLGMSQARSGSEAGMGPYKEWRGCRTEKADASCGRVSPPLPLPLAAVQGKARSLTTCSWLTGFSIACSHWRSHITYLNHLLPVPTSSDFERRVLS